MITIGYGGVKYTKNNKEPQNPILIIKAPTLDDMVAHCAAKYD